MPRIPAKPDRKRSSAEAALLTHCPADWTDLGAVIAKMPINIAAAMDSVIGQLAQLEREGRIETRLVGNPAKVQVQVRVRPRADS